MEDKIRELEQEIRNLKQVINGKSNAADAQRDLWRSTFNQLDNQLDSVETEIEELRAIIWSLRPSDRNI